MGLKVVWIRGSILGTLKRGRGCPWVVVVEMCSGMAETCLGNEFVILNKERK
jgi:hypothetical protein